VSCTDPRGTTYSTDAQDADWLCTFKIDGETNYVYEQSNATGAICVMSGAVPVYTTVLAQISIDGTVSNLDNARYDSGGNHHNDSLKFDYEGQTYKYYHSSYQVNGHPCQAMDCINVYAQGTTTLVTQGCSSARTLSEVCVRINSNGTHAPLVDTFRKCPGSPN
jgi:hypothetical protein